jgi:methionyl-tRNA formyltransferase
MRTVFLGTSEFAAAVLEHLATGAHAAAHRPTLVLTRPDRPAGRGRALSAPPVARRARELGIELVQPASVNEPPARERIAAAAPEAVIVCAFGALIKEPLLSDYQLLNVHPSLLPRWRGAAPIERAIMAGDERTGVSIMRVTAGLDSGPVCAASELPVGPHDTYGTLCERLQDLGAGLLAQTLDRLAAGERLRFVDQDEDGASYAEKIGPADRLLDASRPAVELERTVRALSPHVGARLQLPDGSALGVRRAALAPDAGAADSRPGALYASGERLLLACSSGTLELLEVQPPGKRAMPASAYLRGHGVPPAVA